MQLKITQIQFFIEILLIQLLSNRIVQLIFPIISSNDDIVMIDIIIINLVFTQNIIDFNFFVTNLNLLLTVTIIILCYQGHYEEVINDESFLLMNLLKILSSYFLTCLNFQEFIIFFIPSITFLFNDLTFILMLNIINDLICQNQFQISDLTFAYELSQESLFFI